MSFYIPYALPHVSASAVHDTFQSIFDGDVSVNELTRKDRVSGKDFKLFWIHISGGNKHLVFFTNEILSNGKARITYERTKGIDRYWQVRINLKKTIEQPIEPFIPRILPRF